MDSKRDAKKLEETKKKVTVSPSEGSDFQNLTKKTSAFVTNFVKHIQDSRFNDKEVKSQVILNALRADGKELLKSLAIATTIYNTDEKKEPVETVLSETRDTSYQFTVNEEKLSIKKLTEKPNHYQLSTNSKELEFSTSLSLNEIVFLIKHPINAIAICGNNDLRQVDHMASIYRLLTQIQSKLLPDFIIPDKIFISGKGGHGTSPGPIFGHTEAETMKRRLLEIDIPESKIVIEEKATNSGQNVQFLGPIMLEEQKKSIQPYRHILVSGTPVGILRQVRTFEQQTHPQLKWKRYSSTPPCLDNIIQQYYVDPTSAAINLTAALREFGQFLNYTVNNNFMSNREFPDKLTLKNSIKVFTEYYNQLTEMKSPIDAEKLSKAFLKFSKEKSQHISNEKLKKNLQDILGPMVKFFGTSFNLIELQWMKILSSTQSFSEQSFQIPVSKRTMDIFGVDPVKKPVDTTTSEVKTSKLRRGSGKTP